MSLANDTSELLETDVQSLPLVEVLQKPPTALLSVSDGALKNKMLRAPSAAIAGTFFVLAVAVFANAFQNGSTSMPSWTSSPVPDYTARLESTKTGRDVAPPETGQGKVFPLSDGSFYFHDLGHRCIDFGPRDAWHPGAPVFIFGCNGTAAQHVRVKELDNESHDVELRVSNFCIGVRGGQVRDGEPLDLEVCAGIPSQRFALDGDSILMGGQASGHVTREFAIAPAQRRTLDRTVLLVTSRVLSDAEYFRHEAVDRSGKAPTNGFVRVSNETQLDSALSLGWGTVIEVDDRKPVVLTTTPKPIREGVTLRGYRKYTYQGPEIRTCQAPESSYAFLLAEAAARVTGFRLRGQTSDPQCTNALGNDSSAIRVNTDAFVDTSSVWIDHLDIGYWHGHAVDVRGPVDLTQSCPESPPPFPRHQSVLAVGNFVHHDTNYGIVTGKGAFVLVQGNVFYRQGAHSIAADAVNVSGYMAYDNLILQETPAHDIDMHGSEGGEASHWAGGIAGDYFDIGWNTILPNRHENVKARGTACRFVAIHDNIFTQSKGAAIESYSTKPLVFWNNHFSVTPNPMLDLAVGDFDGDGIDDLFVGTGAAWYYSSGAQSEWRLLNRMPEHASQLRFGDFDGDGRTDVMALHGAEIDISWGGLSPWQTINVTAWPISEIAVGDFDGDRISDLFLSTGTQWFFAPRGRNWTPYGISTYHVKDLRFGDFTNAGRTQVLRVDGNKKWSIVTNVWLPWESYGGAGVSGVGGLVVGDFNGDGFADLGRQHGSNWEYASPGRGFGWTKLWRYNSPLSGKPVGRFDVNATSDVIVWAGRQLNYAPGAVGPLVSLSRRDMK